MTWGISLIGVEVAPLLAEFAQQCAFGWSTRAAAAWAVVRQIGHIGQIGVSHGQRHPHRQHRGQGRSCPKAYEPGNGTQRPVHAYFGNLWPGLGGVVKMS